MFRVQEEVVLELNQIEHGIGNNGIDRLFTYQALAVGLSLSVALKSLKEALRPHLSKRISFYSHLFD
jgi:hypothetical protein